MKLWNWQDPERSALLWLVMALGYAVMVIDFTIGLDNMREATHEVWVVLRCGLPQYTREELQACLKSQSRGGGVTP